LKIEQYKQNIIRRVNTMKRLTKSRSNKMISGVCSGIADYFGIDPTIVRVIWGFSFFAWGSGLLLYILCAIIMPEE